MSLLADIDDVYKQQTEEGIHGYAAPPNVARGKLFVSFERQHRVRPADVYLICFKQLLAKLFLLGRSVVHILQAKRISRERRRLQRKRLRFRRHLSGNLGLRNWALFHFISWLSGDAIGVLPRSSAQPKRGILTRPLPMRNRNSKNVGGRRKRLSSSHLNRSSQEFSCGRLCQWTASGEPRWRRLWR